MGGAEEGGFAPASAAILCRTSENEENTMPSRIDARLAELKIELPNASAPAANYVPYVRSGNLLFMAGQVCIWNGERRFVGKLGREFTVEQGQEAARICGLNLLAQAKAALGGDLDRVVRCVRLGGFVNSMADFLEQPRVVNGASDLMVDVLGDAGRHARTAIGTNVLPFDLAVEVDAVFEVK
jgi:enamine deaminase RidA (YjgF/YER057c/UK114 family)